MDKKDLVIFGGNPIFKKPRSTSNLIKPNKHVFLSYLKETYNDGILSSNNSLISKLEERLATIHGVKYCVSVCNGLWGLVLTINELKIKGRNEIIMPSLTYRRMADIAAWLGITPHFCDVDFNTLGITAETAKSCINENTALILAPHPIVNLCDVEGLEKLAKQYNIPLLFDSVEASYASINDKKIGSFGDAECFSVHASKFLNGFEGGYITTNNYDLYCRLIAARNYGIDAQGEIKTQGIQGEMNSMHAAMTLACLDDLDLQIKKNKERFYYYKELLSKVTGVELIEYSDKERRSFKNIVVKLTDSWPFTREETIRVLQSENMVVRPYYYPPLHLKESTYKVIVNDMKNTNLLMNNHMLLPCGEFVTLDDIKIIVEYLDFIQKNSEVIKIQLNSTAS